jgi:hypothetical protein
MGRRRLLFLPLLLALLARGSPARADGVEYLVKAELLDRVVRFVVWPPSAFPSREAPFIWCLVGPDPFGPSLDAMLQERRYFGRRAEIRRLSGPSGVTGCHLVFVASSQRAALGDILALVRGQPVLIAGDSPGFAEAGVLVNLYVEGGHVGYEIDVDAARRYGLELSGKLLHLARLVHERR